MVTAGRSEDRPLPQRSSRSFLPRARRQPAAFSRFARRSVRAPVGRVGVGDDEVPEWGEFGVGLELEAAPRQLDRFPALAQVEIELRQEQVALSKVGVALDSGTKSHALFGGISE